MSAERQIVIVGAGHSGSKTAAALRKHGWTGGITLVGDEVCLPYDRPPLSKAVLLGKKTVDQCTFYPQSWYETNNIDLRLGSAVSRIDRTKGRLVLAGGSELSYEALVLATGSTANPLTVSGAGLANVWPLRTPDHANAIAGTLSANSRLVVIGAGVIGLEVAAAATERGCQVTVLERADHAMGRSVPSAVSDTLVAVHRTRGVEIRFGVEVSALIGDEVVRQVQLSDGQTVAADAVVYGLGVRPNVSLAADAGLSTDNGIRTNSYLQTQDNQIYACGDVCSYDSQRYGRPVRLENWRNAEDQADTVARNLLDQRVAFDTVPWFWSNQFDLALQVVGLPSIGIRTETQTIGNSRLFLSFDPADTLCGASAFGMVRDIATPLKEYKAVLASCYRS